MPPSIPLALLVSSIAGAGVSAYEALNKPKAPKMPTDTSAQQAEAANAAAQAQAQNLMQRKGAAATMMQSPFGSTPPPAQRATLGN